MRVRHPFAVFILSYITFGIYALMWLVQTKKEINELVGTTIPTAWLLVVPGANVYWLWKYCEAIEELTYGERSGMGTFMMVVFFTLFGLGPAALGMLQHTFNELPEELPEGTHIRLDGLDEDVTVYHISR